MQTPSEKSCGKACQRPDMSTEETFRSTSAQGRLELIPQLVGELVAANVDVLVALYTPCARAAQEATRDIPIVAIVANPVETGFIASLARPGGNITGVSLMAAEAHGKCVEVFADMLPWARKVAALGNASDPFMPCSSKRFTSQQRKRELR